MLLRAKFALLILVFTIIRYEWKESRTLYEQSSQKTLYVLAINTLANPCNIWF